MNTETKDLIEKEFNSFKQKLEDNFTTLVSSYTINEERFLLIKVELITDSKLRAGCTTCVGIDTFHNDHEILKLIFNNLYEKLKNSINP